MRGEEEEEEEEREGRKEKWKGGGNVFSCSLSLSARCELVSGWERVQGGHWSVAILSLSSPACTFFLHKVLACVSVLMNPSILLHLFFPWLSLFSLCDVNQLDEWLRDASICPHSLNLHTRMHKHTQSHLPSLPLFLALYFAVSPTCCSKLLGPRLFQTSLRLKFVNLHLVGAPCWDAPVWFRRWLTAGKWGRLLLSSVAAAWHSQDHSSHCESLHLSKWNRKWAWFVDAGGRKE